MKKSLQNFAVLSCKILNKPVKEHLQQQSPPLDLFRRRRDFLLLRPRLELRSLETGYCWRDYLLTQFARSSQPKTSLRNKRRNQTRLSNLLENKTSKRFSSI